MVQRDDRPDDFNMDERVEEERLVYLAAEMLSRAMEARDVNKTMLAERLGKSKPFITQLLNGGRNLTLRTLARVAFALGYRLRLTLEPLNRVQVDGVSSGQPQTSRVISWAARCAHQPPLEITSEQPGNSRADSSDFIAA